MILIGGVLGFIVFFLYKHVKKNDLFPYYEVVTGPKVIRNDIDLGSYQITTPPNAYFKIVNDKDYNVYVDKIIPDCDCYSVKFDKELVLPNDTLTVEAKYDKYSGPFLKKIHVYFRNRQAPLVLFFRGEVIGDTKSNVGENG